MPKQKRMIGRMMKILHVIIAGSILIWTSIVPAQTNPLPEALLDSQFLRSCTWKEDKGIQGIVRNWPSYTEKQGFVDRTVLNEVQVTILGISFKAEYRVFIKDSLAEIVVYSNKHGEGFCAEFLGWATKHLGKPDKILDRSRLRRDRDGFQNVETDWLLGQSRVQMNCAGTILYGEYIPLFAILIYRHKDELKALEDFIYIECSSTKKFVGPLFKDQLQEEAPPVTMIIDPNRGELLRRDKSTYFKTTKYTDEEILASTEEEGSKSDFRLDRMTGNYQLEIRLKPDSRNGINQWGKCLRVDPGRKF